MTTRGAFGAIVGGVQEDRRADSSQHERFGRHPILATVQEVMRLRALANEGASPAAPALLAAVVVQFVVPLAAILILLAFGIAHFA